ADAEREMAWVIRVIESIRSVRSEMNIAPSEKFPLIVTGAAPEAADTMAKNSHLIERLARVSSCEIADAIPDGAVTIPLEDAALHLPLKGLVDVAAEKARLTKSAGKIDKEINGLEKKLGNQGFLAKAPEEVVEEQRARLTLAKAEAEQINAAMTRLNSLA
ncbi:MAG: valine--tRNA ligase, partial [Pseudomonadota bacterium]